MHEKLEQHLLEKHARLFLPSENEQYPIYGFECGDGWFLLLTTLFDAVEKHIWHAGEFQSPEHEHLKDLRVLQVKEKFGGLRVYTSYSTPHLHSCIDFAYAMSIRTCEFCGNPGKLFSDSWIRCRCSECGLRLEESRDRLKLVPDMMLDLVAKKDKNDAAS